MKNLILLPLIIISTLSFAQEKNCSKFKNGKYKINSQVSGVSHIERKGSRQIEYGEFSGLKVKLKVKWLNECTYTLQLKKVIKNPGKFDIPKALILTVEILEIKENSYVQKTSANLYDMELVDEVFKVE